MLYPVESIISHLLNNWALIIYFTVTIETDATYITCTLLEKKIKFIKLVSFTSKQIQWNPVNMVPNGPKKFGRFNRVAIQYINEGFLQENVRRFLPGSQKKWP